MRPKDATVHIPNNPYITAMQEAVDAVYADFGLNPVCTSGNEPTTTHKKGSLHYADRAVDIRFWDLLAVVAHRLREKLPPYYDILVEKDHFHLEADANKERRHGRT